MTLIAANPYWCGELGVPDITDSVNIANFKAAAGSTMYVQLDWTHTELVNNAPNPPVYDWTQMDLVMSTLSGANLRVCWVLQGAPSWHSSQVPGSGDPSLYITPADAAVFATAVLSRYPHQIQYMIVGNEAYSTYQPKNGSKDPAIGQPLLAAVYPAVKAVDPTIQVGIFPLLNGSSTQQISDWWTILYTGNSPQFGNVGPLVKYADFVTLHYYSGNHDPAAPNANGLQLSDWLTLYKSASGASLSPLSGAPVRLPLLITEFGWTASNNPQGGQVTPAQQADYYQHLLDISRQSGVVTHVAYFHYQGLFVNNGNTPRPAYTMLQSYVAQYPQWTSNPLASNYAIRTFAGAIDLTNLQPPSPLPSGYALRTFGGAINLSDIAPPVPLPSTYALRTFGGAIDLSQLTPPPVPGPVPFAVLVNGQQVNVLAGSLTMSSTIGRRAQAAFTSWDETGVTHFQQYQQVSIFDNNGALAFSGYIINPQEVQPGQGPLLVYTITCIDQHWLADKRIVAKYYLGQTYGSIVNDLATTILAQEGVTIGQIVDGGLAIPQVVFSYATISQALDAMVIQASSTGTPFYWMIDQFKVLWFVPYTTMTGPTTDGTTIDNGYLSGTQPIVTRANPAYRNTQYITGGNAATSSVTETHLGDSHTRSWTMGYPIASAPTITVDGTSKTVGVKGTSGSNYYWAAGDPVVTQDVGQTLLTSSNTLSVTYIGQYPNVFTGNSPAQIAYQQSIDGTSGIVESVLNDNTIASVQDGLARVGQQLSVYGTQGIQFVFNTLQSGYTAAQLCPVNYPPLGLNNLQMLIEEVDASDQQDNYNLWYTVKAIVGPYDTNWQQFFGNILQQGQPNSINVGQSGGGEIPTPDFTMAVNTSFTFNVSIGTAWYPSNQIYPSNSLYPSSG